MVEYTPEQKKEIAMMSAVSYFKGVSEDPSSICAPFSEELNVWYELLLNSHPGLKERVEVYLENHRMLGDDLKEVLSGKLERVLKNKE